MRLLLATRRAPSPSRRCCWIHFSGLPALGSWSRHFARSVFALPQLFLAFFPTWPPGSPAPVPRQPRSRTGRLFYMAIRLCSGAAHASQPRPAGPRPPRAALAPPPALGRRPLCTLAALRPRLLPLAQQLTLCAVAGLIPARHAGPVSAIASASDSSEAMFAGPRHSGVLWYTMLQKEHSSAVSVLGHCWQPLGHQPCARPLRPSPRKGSQRSRRHRLRLTSAARLKGARRNFPPRTRPRVASGRHRSILDQITKFPSTF